MTLHVADIASYQQGLTLAAVRAAGFGVVNVKVSHGLGVRSVHPQAADWIAGARAAGMGVSTFHYLDNSASGVDQANWAYACMVELGALEGTAHQVDCESTATEQILVDYLAVMQRLLRRPVVVYTGDWWWRPRGWNVADLTPYVWAAPNAGYLGAYPGDDSPHWACGYGGWTNLAVMQHSVAPVAGVRVSQSAIREPLVWAALTGEEHNMAWELVRSLVSLRDEFNEVAPGRDKSTDGAVGNEEHAASVSDHNPDETGNTATEDADSVNEVHAIDVDQSGPWPDGFDMERAVQTIVARHKAGKDDRLQNVIYRRRIWSKSWGWAQRPYAGANAHDEHAHFSARYTTAQEDDVRPWGLRELIDMNGAEMLATLRSAEGQKVIYDAVNQDRVRRYGPDGKPVPVDPAHPGDENMTWASALSFVNRDTAQIKKWLVEGVNAVLAAANVDHLDEELLAQLVATAVLAGLPDSDDDGPVSAEQLQASIVGALRELATPPA